MIIDTAGLSAGEHTLVLQSFDENSKVGSTLKTDTITIVITTESLPTFVENPSDETLVANQEKRWELPEIVEGAYPLAKVLLRPPEQLKSLLSYDQDTNTITFAGSKDLLALSTDFTAIIVTLVNENGNSSEYV